MHIVRSNEDQFNILYSNFHNHCCPTALLSLLDIRFQIEYATDIEYINRSFLICEKEKVLAAFVASIQIPTGKMDAFGRDSLYFESPDLDKPEKKQIRKALNKELTCLVEDELIQKFTFTDMGANKTISPVVSFFLDKGAVLSNHLTQIVDLYQTEAELKSDLRKRYKSMINWGLKNLSIQVLDNRNINYLDSEAFRQLHISVAGRETRSKKTWDTQFEQVKSGEAFILTGRLDNKLVTCAHFNRTSKMCFYSVGASVRELFEKPISHAILWSAILYAKEQGCRYFDLGEQLFTSGTPKEINISKFKRGFGGDCCSHLKLIYKI